MNDTILGAIIGSAIALLGSIVGFAIQYRIDLQRSKRDLRKEAYISTLKWISRYGTSDMELYQEETQHIWEDAKIKMFLYASKTALAAFYNVENNGHVEQDVEALKAIIKEEVGFIR
ncbi:MAG: hypothetical protein ACK5ML_08720 [Lachnospiraceae bacterium]